MFDIYGMYVCKIFEDTAKKQYSLLIFQTHAVSCLVRRDVPPYLLVNVSREQLVFWIGLLFATPLGFYSMVNDNDNDNKRLCCPIS